MPASGWRSARLPYVGGTLAMTVVLPDSGRLADVEALVAERDWSAVLDAPSHERLELRLPRFTVRAAARLGELLATLGMPTAFTDDADFSGLTVDEPLKISEVLHEAFVAVDEEGTEAAAATAVVMQRAGAMPQPPVPFVVDRPFLFAIHERVVRHSAVPRQGDRSALTRCRWGLVGSGGTPPPASGWGLSCCASLTVR